MLSRTRRARLLVAAGIALTGTVGLAGCGDDDGKGDDTSSPEPTPSVASSSPAAYLEVPAGITLTEPGTALGLGEPGVIAFQRRQDEIGVLSVTVQRIERTSFQESFQGWNVDDATAARTPYFVRLMVTNVGDTDLGGYTLDSVLWADDGSTLEAPNYYTAQQQPACHGGPLPTAFANGASAELCQVYFIAPAHALEGVAFPPYGGLEDITWSGEISKVTPPPKPEKPRKGDRKGRTVKPSTTPSSTATPSGTASSSPSAS